MAVLSESGLSFGFTFKELDDCLWVRYEFFFRWKDEYVFRDELLKRSPAGWSGRSEGALLANESDEDSFLPVLKQAVDATEPVCWEPIEPDVMCSGARTVMDLVSGKTVGVGEGGRKVDIALGDGGVGNDERQCQDWACRGVTGRATK